MPNKKNNDKTVEAIRHDDATRKNVPTAEYQSVMRETEVGDQESGVGGQRTEDRWRRVGWVERSETQQTGDQYRVSSIEYSATKTY